MRNHASRAMCIAMAIASTSAIAEEADEFSRANCFNNESITYDYFAPYWWGGVTAHHYDTQNGNLVHYVGHEDPQSCYGQDFPPPGTCPTGTFTQDALCWPYQQCYWLITEGNAFKAIHNTFDSVALPGFSSRWRVRGAHLIFYGYYFENAVYSTNYTEATDCNLHFDQFY